MKYPVNSHILSPYWCIGTGHICLGRCSDLQVRISCTEWNITLPYIAENHRYSRFFQLMAFSRLFITAHNLFLSTDNQIWYYLNKTNCESWDIKRRDNVVVNLTMVEVLRWSTVYAAISHCCELLSAWSHGINQLLLLSCSVQFILAVFHRLLLASL